MWLDAARRHVASFPVQKELWSGARIPSNFEAVEIPLSDPDQASGSVGARRDCTIVPACVSNLRSDGVVFRRIVPDHVRIELVVTWPTGEMSAVRRSFLDLLTSEAAMIRTKVAGHLP